ncbi:MAG: TonB-dependent receptor [Pseudomonadota bacterium]
MRVRSKSFATSLTASTALLAVAHAPAMAQAVESDEPSDSLEAEDGGSDISVIIVRGQRIEQTEFETATSVTVFTENELRSFPGAQNTNDLILRVPNITFSDDTLGQFTVRGNPSGGALIGGDAFVGGSKARATTTVDGYPISFNEFIFGVTSLYDVEQVEVYRGPQTTTQGQNAIAGALQVFTNDPTNEFEVGGLIETGNRDRLQVAGYVSGPIVKDELSFRVVGDFRQLDSFIDFSTAPNQLPGTVVDRTEGYVVRGKLLWTPSAIPGLEAKLTISDSDGFRPLGGVPLDDPGSLEFGSGTVGQLRSGSTVGIFDLSYDINDSLTFVNQTSYADFDLRYRLPMSAANDFLFAETDGTKLSQETYLALNSSESILSGLVGVFYTRTEQDDSIFLGSPQDLQDTQQALGIYGRATLNVTDRLSVTGGLRYQYDDQVRVGTFFFPVAFDESFDAFLPSIEVAYDASDNVRVGIDVSRGFNPGGFTLSFDDGSQASFEEETVWTYDAFIRARFLDGRINITGNVFYSDFDNFQKGTVVGFDPAGLPIIRTDNVETAENYGLELAADIELTDTLTISGSLGLLEANFDELVAPGQVATFDFAQAPAITAFGSVIWRPIDRLTLSGQVRYSDDYFNEDDNILANQIGAFTLIDASARYDFGSVQLYGFIENLADRIAPTSVSGFAPFATIAPPRTYGVGLEFRF